MAPSKNNEVSSCDSKPSKTTTTHHRNDPNQPNNTKCKRVFHPAYKIIYYRDEISPKKIARRLSTQMGMYVPPPRAAHESTLVEIPNSRRKNEQPLRLTAVFPDEEGGRTSTPASAVKFAWGDINLNQIFSAALQAWGNLTLQQLLMSGSIKLGTITLQQLLQLQNPVVDAEVLELDYSDEEDDDSDIEVDIDLEGIKPGYMSTEEVFTVIVKSDSLRDIVVKYNIRESQTFEAMYEDYAVRMDYKNKNDLTIKKKNVPIPPCCTPIEVGIVDNDVLIVYGKEPEDNMNVRRKLFWVRDVMTTPRKKMVSAKLITPLRRLYIMWGATVNEDKAKLVVMYENEVLTSIQTVGEAKIKNKYEVFALPVSIVNENF